MKLFHQFPARQYEDGYKVILKLWIIIIIIHKLQNYLQVANIQDIFQFFPGVHFPENSPEGQPMQQKNSNKPKKNI